MAYRIYDVELSHPNYPPLNKVVEMTVHEQTLSTAVFITAPNMGCSRDYHLSDIDAICAFAAEHGARVKSSKGPRF